MAGLSKPDPRRQTKLAAEHSILEQEARRSAAGAWLSSCDDVSVLLQASDRGSIALREATL
jgi:hypothetical protein